MITPDMIVNEARSWVGVRWKHLGRTRNGIDCGGLVLLVGRAHDVVHYDPGGYPHRPNGDFMKHFDRAFKRANVLHLTPGHIVVFAESTHECHCGIVSKKYGELAVIHAHCDRRQVIEETLWEAESVVGRPVYAYQYHGVMY